MKNVQKAIQKLRGVKPASDRPPAVKRPVIITGASSGIGTALAYEYAKRGYDIGLAARRTAVLDQIKADLEFQHKIKVATVALDVRKVNTVGPAIEKLATDLGGAGLVIANSGITGVRSLGKGRFEMDVDIVETNLLGGMATVEAAAKIFRESGGGHIVGLSSFMALRGIVGTGAYAASKCGFDAYLDTARAELAPRKIKVSIIRAGFVKTDLMDKMDKYPFLTTADKFAKEMADVVETNPADVIVPSMPWKPLRYVVRLIPDAIWRKMF